MPMAGKQRRWTRRSILNLALYGIAIAAFSASASVGYADEDTRENHSFTYRVSGYPAIGDCHTAAADLGVLFKAHTRITPESAECRDISEFGFVLEIVYKAPQRLSLLTTAPTSLRIGVSPGQFDTRDACEAQLPAEVVVFKGHTGLDKMVAYCFRDEHTSINPWAIRIDAFDLRSTAPRRPFMTGTMMLELPASTDLVGVRDGMRARLTARGVDVRHINIRGAGPVQGELSMLYYAAKPFDLELTQHAKTTTFESCVEQLELARAVFADAPSTPLSMYCASSFIGGSHYLMGFYQDGSGFSVIDAPNRFDSYAVCEASRIEILNGYRARLGARVKGALCTLEDEVPFEAVWRVRVFALPANP